MLRQYFSLTPVNHFHTAAAGHIFDPARCKSDRRDMIFDSVEWEFQFCQDSFCSTIKADNFTQRFSCGPSASFARARMSYTSRSLTVPA